MRPIPGAIANVILLPFKVIVPYNKTGYDINSQWDQKVSDKNLNAQIQAYKDVFASGLFQSTHQGLVKVVQNLRADFHKKYTGELTIGSVMHGYIDFTYFYIQTDYLKKKKLKLAIVLNHQKAQFELWLLGQTKSAQKEYWEKLASTKWITSNEMPTYSIFEVVLLSSPDFDNVTSITHAIQKNFDAFSSEINRTLSAVD
ncbi:DUF7000 family protein [Thalassotalea loyana]|uniref:DUF7000 family protein n=1 Tax=Thalassotalea loyana TaxID=280483 RepID=UPI0024E09A10|nr:hypothetical protein [Thalassotalea loyana]